MANKVQLNRSARSRVNLNSQTITTARAVCTQPVLVHEVVPRDTFKVTGEMINRVDALVVSSFCSFKNRIASFYVKNSQVWKPFDSFMTGSPYAFGYINSIPTKKPYFSALDLFRIFTYSTTGSRQLVTAYDVTSQIQNPDDARRLIEEHDYEFIRHYNNVYTGYKFTVLGSRVYKALYSLGYRFPNYVDHDLSVDQFIQLEQSLLPLMAYMSILVNYYTPLKYKSFAFVNSLSYLIDPVPQHFQGLETPNQDMLNFLNSIIDILSSVYYGDDYFTSALRDVFRSPNGGSVNTNFVDPTTSSGLGADVNYAVDGVEPYEVPSLRTLEGQGDDNYAHFTEYLLYALKAMTGQAQLSALTLNDINAATLAKFGYKAECADMVPYLLKKVDSRINVSPEVSTADTRHEDPVSGETVGAPIGFKAGKGEGFAKISGTFKFDNYGVFIVLDSIMPDYFYPYGIRRSLLRVRQKDEYNKNYNRLGVQPVASVELDINIQNPMNAWGFSKKYGDMAEGNNILSGDFIINTQNEGLDAFHFARKVPRTSVNGQVFMMADNGRQNRRYLLDGNQFNRVFIDEGLSDPIQQWYIWKIDAWRQIPGDMTIGENDGEVVETKPLGATMNG